YAFQQLYEDLKENYRIYYLLGSRVNQDLLECQFSLYRSVGGSNTCPNAVEFRHRLKVVLLGTRARKSNKTNCEFEAMDVDTSIGNGIANLALLAKRSKENKDKVRDQPVKLRQLFTMLPS